MTDDGHISESQKVRPLNTQSIRGVVGGFWIRAVSLLLDVIVLNFFFYALTFLFREQFFVIGKNTVYIGAAIFFGYFWLLNGPIGHGRTLGKFLFNLRTQDYEGNVLTLGASFRRTIIQMNYPIIAKLAIDPLMDGADANSMLFLIGILSILRAFLASNALLIALHPLKQGYHDQFAKSLVVRGLNRVRYTDLKQTVFGGMLNRKVRTPAVAMQSAGIAFLVILLLQMWGGYQGIRSQEWRSHHHLFVEMREKFGVEGFKLEGFDIFKVRLKSEEGKPQKLLSGTRSRDLTASPSLTAPDSEHRFVVFYSTYRDVSEAEIKGDKEIRAMLPILRDWVQNKLETVYQSRIEKGEIPKKIQVQFIERFSLFIYSHHKMEAEFLLPIKNIL